MKQSKIARNAHKKHNSTRRGAALVRLDRRDLGLGAVGLAAVRALVLAGGERSERDGEGEGGGSRFARGGDGAMGLGRQNLA